MKQPHELSLRKRFHWSPAMSPSSRYLPDPDVLSVIGFPGSPAPTVKSGRRWYWAPPGSNGLKILDTMGKPGRCTIISSNRCWSRSGLWCGAIRSVRCRIGTALESAPWLLRRWRRIWSVKPKGDQSREERRGKIIVCEEESRFLKRSPEF